MKAFTMAPRPEGQRAAPHAGAKAPALPPGVMAGVSGLLRRVRAGLAAPVVRRALRVVPGARPATRRQGHIALVGAGPGTRDLLTLRAVQRLQEADIVLYDRLVDPEVLKLAPRGAETLYVGKEVGACAWPQARIDRLIVEEARRGRRVVRLKSGDPSVFGRACEEIAAARAAGIEVEIVPGITAASAAAAAMVCPLTERGETDTFVLTTGTCRPGDAAPDRALLARPGTTIAFYMAVEKAARVQNDLLAAGAPADCPVDIVASVATNRETHVATTLDQLSRTVRDRGIASPAVLMVRYPKSLAATAARDCHAA
ncbi:uroporphyrinogen-III C-methyltransferase [Acidimangrovimonas sediminis]|uniref:uroporphyrinogen-III C-methyltransferase n=1 Tax=Acidimangrovimonas sediminis TaxID=2056283 RepID=UPI001E56F0FF|nr:uroporphyrinogen-III C-methyltransferase [Acidimangrovimonas sediminis]